MSADLLDDDGNASRLRLVPGTTVTKLPFGGAVLVNATTLAIADVGERDAELLELLLAHGPPGPGRPSVVREFVDQLVEAGWITTDHQPRGTEP
ncbi:MAG: actinodefensin-associated protein B [Actinomycetota bacterium]|nr:actinodefensin-associated protein B [Actinomycetota bacterium]